MTEGMRKKLIDAGRQDLIDIYEINQSGYAGILPNGNIVDRRKFPDAIPVQENKLIGIPKSKSLPYAMLKNNIYSLIYTELKPGTDKDSTQAIIDIRDIEKATKAIVDFIENTINKCEQLELPNGANGAIWKDDLKKYLNAKL